MFTPFIGFVNNMINFISIFVKYVWSNSTNQYVTHRFYRWYFFGVTHFSKCTQTCAYTVVKIRFGASKWRLVFFGWPPHFFFWPQRFGKSGANVKSKIYFCWSSYICANDNDSCFFMCYKWLWINNAIFWITLFSK